MQNLIEFHDVHVFDGSSISDGSVEDREAFIPGIHYSYNRIVGLIA
jgi:hypothetical protein